MISLRNLSRKHKIICLIVGLLFLNTHLAYAKVHLSVDVSDPLLFREYFWIDDDGFGGYLSDFIELADGNYKIIVFGPRDGMFYDLTISVKVTKSVPEVQSVSFYSFCIDTGIKSEVKEWPPPEIIKTTHKSLSNTYRLLIGRPIIAKRKDECEPIPAPIMAQWTDIGVLKLNATSRPPGAEVLVNGKSVGKTNSILNVPYRSEQQNINVVIRVPGSANCRWSLKGPFNEAQTHCAPK